MLKRRSKEEWQRLVEDYISSGLTLTNWCKEHEISKSSIAPYVRKYRIKKENLSDEWGAINIPYSYSKSDISIKIGPVTIDIKENFNKETLLKILDVVTKIC